MPADPTADPAPSVADEVVAGQGLGAREVARALPPGRNSRPVHPATVFRWMTAGIKLPGGRIVKLEALRIGGRLVTSRPALKRFITAQQPDAASPATAPRTLRAPAARRKAADRAEEALLKMGC